MEKGKANTSAALFISRNWIKIVLALVVLYLFMQKDFSLQFNLRSPLQEEAVPGEVPTARLKREKLSEKVPAEPVTASNATKRDLLEMPSLFGNKEAESTLRKQLRGIPDEDKIAYLKRFAHVAIAERKKFGIPSSIILSSGLLHSLSGQRDVALSSNNHFGLRCSDPWTGATASHQGICYRAYDNAWEGFRDHSLFLDNPSFAHLRELGQTDYQAWARGLERLPYSPEPDLADQLIELIEYFRLYELDKK